MKIILYIFTALALAFSVLSCDKAFKVEKLQIYPQSVSMELPDTSQLSFSIVYTGGDFNDPQLITPQWTTSNANIVEVNDSGRIVSKAEGTANVSVTCGELTSTCVVTVVPL